MVFLAVQKFISLIWSYLFIFAFCFYLGDWSKKNIDIIYVRECFAHFLLGLLWCHVLYWSLQAILSLFLCMVWSSSLISLSYMQLYNFPNTTAEENVFSPSYILAFFVED